MKGFFSARGQGIRSNNGQFEKGSQPQGHATTSHELGGKGSSLHPSRGNQLVNSQNAQIQGMFSPRRNIMSGTNSNAASFVGMRQPQQSSQQRQGSSKIKNQQVQSLSINTNLNN